MRAIILALLLSGCAAIDRIYDASRWERDGFETATYTWHHETDPVRCGIHYNVSGRYWGCAVRVRDATPQPGAKVVSGTTAASGHCFIYSNVATEEEARRITTRHGDDLWSHETRHCRGWRHPGG